MYFENLNYRQNISRIEIMENVLFTQQKEKPTITQTDRNARDLDRKKFGMKVRTLVATK